MVFGTIGALVGLLITAAQAPSAWPWVALALFLIAATAVLLRATSTGETTYFEPIFFGEPRERVVVAGLHGLLNCEKAQPEFVHAAPKNKEVDVICRQLTRSGFSTVYGGPGEGKSMTAYHAAYRLQCESRNSSYKLKVDLLTGGFSDFRAQLLEQIDSLKGKRKLIIVDDAHKLADRMKLNELMRDEASDAELKVIWLETEFYKDESFERPGSHVQIDFSAFLDQLLTNLYRSKNGIFVHELQGQTEGLEEALDGAAHNEIRDAWHFAFVASHGEEKVGEEISKLDDSETLIVFLVSAHTIVSGEERLSIAELLNMLGKLNFGWLTDSLRKKTYSDMIRSLQEYRFESLPDRREVQRMSLIRLYDKAYVTSLHYNCARAIVTAALRATIAEDLLASLRTLLVSDYRRCTHLGVLLRSLGSRGALAFAKANEKWLVDFLSNPSPDMLQSFVSALTQLQGGDATYRDYNFDSI